MKKPFRTVAFVLAHIGLAVCVLFLLFFLVGKFVPAVGEIAKLDFFVFDYFYLIVPILALCAGILLQIAVVQPKRRKKKSAQRTAETK